MVTWEYQFYPIKKGTYNNNFSILTTNKLYSTRHYYNILKKLSIFDRKGKKSYLHLQNKCNKFNKKGWKNHFHN